MLLELASDVLDAVLEGAVGCDAGVALSFLAVGPLRGVAWNSVDEGGHVDLWLVDDGI